MTSLALPAIGLYCAASWRLARRVATGESVTPRSGLVLGMIAVLAHAALHGYVQWRGGIDLHFFAALSLVALGMAALSTGVAWTRNFVALGSIVYPLAALCLTAYAIVGSRPLATELGWPLRLHALLALLAFATLALAAVLAAFLLLQDQLLRRRALDHPLLRLLPPLTELESLLFRTLAAGFVLLTLALTIGTVFVESLFAQHLMHKTVLSVLSWIAFGVLLYGRVRHGWRGRRAARLTLTAMALLLLAFFGSKFVLELVLGRA